ncbi:MAG: outer membrane beta-barrel protein [Bacteroidales bacterium]|jgi:hypothetical protein|nr:outer membrane beta-barrel protein [Bacteroidales bacterium]
MKKITILLLAILVSGGLFAQMPNFGIKVAATAASLNTADLDANLDSDNLMGYSLGAFVRLNSGKMYLQPEVVYNHRSTQLVGFQDYNVNIDIGTIDVPVLVGFKLIDRKVFNIRAFLGPELSFATSDPDLTYDPNSSGDLALSDFNELTWYAQAGIGIDLLFLTFDIRYEKGLNNLYNGTDVDFSNNVFVFSLGMKFM